MSKVFKVTATMDFGFHIFIRAKDADEAMEKAGKIDGMGDWWVKSDDGHDWTLEQAWEASKDEYEEEDVFVEDEDPDEQLGKKIYSGQFFKKEENNE
tara:strand:+ start:440 stop:730 length:291 start_codon:yes stop_codon:yes gene_type:complete